MADIREFISENDRIRGKVSGVGELRGNTVAITTIHTDAYNIAVRNGFEGTEEEWLASLKGEKGDKGDTGAKGDKGDTGAKGERGAQGVQGAQGIQGVQGLKGDPGATGPQGPQGPQGERGPQGIAGVAVQTVGYVAFNVTEDGILQCTYSGDEQPKYSINDDGHLIIEI